MRSGRDELLVERDVELRDIEAFVARLRGRCGGTLVIEGPPGIGKTVLLNRVGDFGSSAGHRVLVARAVELERELGFAVLRDLFSPILSSSPADERDEVFTGTARFAKNPLGLGQDQEPVELGAAIHGLYWMCVNLSDRTPLVLLVDDLHWADEQSLLFLNYLAHRATEHPILIVVTMRPADREPAERALRSIGGEADRVLRLGPLSRKAVADIVDHHMPDDAAPELAAACTRLTGGNPLLLTEMLRELRGNGLAATARGVEHLDRFSPEALSRALLARIARLGPAAQEVATAAAILGPDADLRRVAALAGRSQDDVAEAIAGLRREGILDHADRLDFIHPLIRTAVYTDVPAVSRGLGHVHAARLLSADGRDSRVPAHLLLGARGGDPWVVSSLKEAAQAALVSGSPATAAVLLERALDEPAQAHERIPLTVALGRALLNSGDSGAAVTVLEDVSGHRAESTHRTAVALELARALRLEGRVPAAMSVLERAVRELTPDHPAHRDQEVELELEIALTGHLGVPASEWIDRLAAVARRHAGTSLPERTLRSMYAYVAASTGSLRAEDVAALARTCVDENDVVSPLSLQGVAASLAMSGRFGEALRLLDSSLAISHRNGDVAQAGFALFTRTWVANRAGRVLEGEADARALLAAPGGRKPYLHYAAAHLMVALLDRGALDEAEALLAEHGLTDQNQFEGPMGAVLHIARGRLYRLRNSYRRAVADFERCREILTVSGFTGPSFGEWRMDGALSYLGLGDRHQAIDIADEDVELSRAFGAPRELGIALRSRGIAEGGVRGLDLLSESVDVLSTSEAPLDHAKSLVELGAALRRAGKRVAAREPLARGLDVASRCGATAVTDRARDELLTAGARPRRERLTGPQSLTASEFRVARLAADGCSNREIAQALFVTRRTVELHLTHAYRKLGIGSREALVTALRV